MTASAGARWIAGSLLAALILFVFLPTLGQGWAPIDDELNFVDNPDYRGFSIAHLRWIWTTRLAGHYIPLSWMTLAADFAWSGMDPWGYHLTNVVLHLANGLLLFALAGRLFEPASEKGSSILGAFACAAFFALHPLRVESVAWITERRDVLCGLFSLLAVLAYCRAARDTGTRRPLVRLLALVAFAAALLSKGIAIMLPVALLALDVRPLRRLNDDPRRWLDREARPVLLEKLPYLVLAAVVAGVTLWAAAPVRHQAQTGLEHRLLSAGFGLSFYLEKTLLPLAIPFQMPVTHLLSLSRDGLVALRGVLFLVLCAATLGLWRRTPALALALAVFAAFVLPVSGLFQAGPQLAAHRYTYLATMPLALLLGAAIEVFARRAPSRRWVAAAAVGVTTLGLAVATRAQVGLWQDPVTFMRAAVRAAPDDWASVSGLARVHLERGEAGEALAVVRAGRERSPDALMLIYLEAMVLATSSDDGLRDGRQAVALASRAARLTGLRDPAALLALAAARAELGETAEARRILVTAEGLAKAGRKPAFLPLLQKATRQIEASGNVRFDAGDWRGSAL